MFTAAASSSFHPSTSLIIRPRNMYDVFLSFRGEDTRGNFTSHLYEALRQNGIQTFIDDRLNRGYEISKSLLDAIEASTISLVIFSEGYASSSWCLDELLKIFECKNNYQQIVIPVFYWVDPSHVRKQSGTFGDLFSKLQKGPDKMLTWRNALTEAANLSGFHSHNYRTESDLMKEVVNRIVKILAEVFPRVIKDQLVGVESQVREIESLLALGTGSIDVCSLGIWGTGGVGKTTIARAVFHKISSDFEGSCFLSNVREESEKPGGLACLKQKLVSKLLNDKYVMTDLYDLDFRLSRKKVLIVFDDVNSSNQIESLIGSLDLFMPESRIIITTRDQQVLRNCGVKKFEVKTLEYHHALELFCRHAFKQNHPDVGFKDLSLKVVNYAQGLPLALKVLGRFLFEREKQVWESAIKKLEKFVDLEIQEVLKISYDDLHHTDKNIFLDLACFFKGEEVNLVMKFLDACGFYPGIGISVLVDKSLISISNDEIIMHDLLQEMGREIVRQESVNDPGKRSRLWHHEDIFNVLTLNTGTEAIEGICLDMSRVKEIYLNPSTFTRMHKLRLLKFYCSMKGENKCKASYFRGPGLAEVRYLHWHGYPLRSLPSNFQLEKLVSLEMPCSNIEQLWDGDQHYGILNWIIAPCKLWLTKIPNPSLTQHLKMLVTLNLSHCRSLKSIAASIHFECLKELNVSYCSNLKTLPEISCGNIEKMLLTGTAIEELPLSIGFLSTLLVLGLADCKNLKSLPSSICQLKSLERLFLCGCSSLQRLPDELGNLKALQILRADGTAIRGLPASVSRMKDIEELSFNGSLCLSFPISLSSDGLHSLTNLDLNDSGIMELPESLGQLSSLQFLELGRNNFKRIPESIVRLYNLTFLVLSHCERLESIPKLPCNLVELYAEHCTALESVSDLFSSNDDSYSYWKFDLRNCLKLDQNKIRRILENGLQHFLFMAIAFHNEEQREKYQRVGCVFLPGNEIPKWFRFQSMGSYISMKEMPPGFFNNTTVIGFAFSFILTFGRHRKFGEVLDLVLKECDGHVFRTWVGKIKYVESDHLFMGYCFFSIEDINMLRSCNCTPKALEFSLERQVESLEVKKSGIHFIYAPVFSIEDINLLRSTYICSHSF